MGPEVDDSVLHKFEEYIEEFFIPWYKMDEKDLSSEQIDGEDPIWEIEQIKSHTGKYGKKRKYLIKWVDSDNMTYEPESNLVKYGAQKLLSEYKASLRLKEKNNSKSKSKKSGYYSKVCNDDVYYCNYPKRRARWSLC